MKYHDLVAASNLALEEDADNALLNVSKCSFNDLREFRDITVEVYTNLTDLKMDKSAEPAETISQGTMVCDYLYNMAIVFPI